MFHPLPSFFCFLLQFLSSCIIFSVIPGSMLEMPKMTPSYASYINEQLSRLHQFYFTSWKNSWTGQGNKLFGNTGDNKMLTTSQERSVESRLSQSNLISLVDRLRGPVHEESHTSALVLCFALLHITFF